MPWPLTLQIRDTLGEYVLDDEIASGGVAHVYEAHNEAGQHVALKVMPLDATAEGIYHPRAFRHEAEALMRLDHPNIVRVYAVDESDQYIYIAMQLVTGGTLRNRLNVTRRLSVHDVCVMGIQMAHALAYMNRNHITHRDVKPSNILIDGLDPDHYLLADFGIAKITGQHGVSKTGMALGTPEYMSPEQANGGVVDGRADIYSLACVLYEALAGRAVFVADTPLAICHAQLHTLPVSVLYYNTSVPYDLWTVLSKALDKNPNRRYLHADLFAEALTPFLAITDLAPPVPALDLITRSATAMHDLLPAFIKAEPVAPRVVFEPPFPSEPTSDRDQGQETVSRAYLQYYPRPVPPSRPHPRRAIERPRVRAPLAPVASPALADEAPKHLLPFPPLQRQHMVALPDLPPRVFVSLASIFLVVLFLVLWFLLAVFHQQRFSHGAGSGVAPITPLPTALPTTMPTAMPTTQMTPVNTPFPQSAIGAPESVLLVTPGYINHPHCDNLTEVITITNNGAAGAAMSWVASTPNKTWDMSMWNGQLAGGQSVTLLVWHVSQSGSIHIDATTSIGTPTTVQIICG